MGSLGSGRSRTHNRGNVEDAIALDIRQLQKVNALRPQHMGAVPIHSRNGRVAHLIICGDPSGNAIWVPHTARDASEPFRIALEWRPCRFGGRRPLLHCPACGRATTTLFRLSAWCCRRCGKLSYQSQNEGDLARAEARVNARRRKLDPADLGYKHLGRNEMPVRPKGMWQRTYQRLLADIERAKMPREWHWPKK